MRATLSRDRLAVRRTGAYHWRDLLGGELFYREGSDTADWPQGKRTRYGVMAISESRADCRMGLVKFQFGNGNI